MPKSLFYIIIIHNKKLFIEADNENVWLTSPVTISECLIISYSEVKSCTVSDVKQPCLCNPNM